MRYLTRPRAVRIGIVLASIALVGILGHRLIPHIVIRIDSNHDVDVALREKLPIELQINKQADIALPPSIDANVVLANQMQLSVDRDLQVPLDMEVEVPIDTSVMVDQTLNVTTSALIDVVLTEREINLERLTIPIDTSMQVDDDILVSTILPIDTTVTTTLGVRVPVKANLPINMRVPVHQRLHVKDTFDVGVKSLRAPLHIVIPLDLEVPIHQPIHVTGQVRAPIHRTVPIHLGQIVVTPAATAIPISVKMPDHMPAQVVMKVDSDVSLREHMAVQLGTVQVKASSIGVGLE